MDEFHNDADRIAALTAEEGLPVGFDSSTIREDMQDVQDELNMEKGMNEPQSLINSIWQLYKLLSILSAGGILGVLARRGLIALSSYDGAYISGVIWSNLTACVVMGIAIESDQFWSQLTPMYATLAQIPLYTGITTGFCGLLSSFSSMILEIFEKTMDLLPTGYSHYPNAAYGIMEFLSVLIAQIAIAISGLQFGRHISQLNPLVLPGAFYSYIELSFVFLGTAGWIVAIVLAAADHHDRAWTLSCVFAPLGVYSRFYLSKWLNQKVKDFPMGTFASNLLGTTLLLIINLLNRGKTSLDGRLVPTIISCQVLEALADGYCGAFTTVSTFAVELYGLEIIFSYRYGFISIIVSFIVLLLIMGPFNWVIGFAPPVC